MDGRFKVVYDKSMLIMDTIGLAIFTVVGVNIGIQQGYLEKIFLLTWIINQTELCILKLPLRVIYPAFCRIASHQAKRNALFQSQNRNIKVTNTSDFQVEKPIVQPDYYELPRTFTDKMLIHICPFQTILSHMRGSLLFLFFIFFSVFIIQADICRRWSRECDGYFLF